MTNNNIAQQQRLPFSPITVEGNGNAQDRAICQNIHSISHNVVPNVPQISVIDLVRSSNVSQQPIQPFSPVTIEGNYNVQDRALC